MSNLPKIVFLDVVDGPSPSEKVMAVALFLAAVALVTLVYTVKAKRNKK